MDESHPALLNDPQAAHASLDREVHVWLSRPSEIRDPELIAGYHEMLDADERRREARFVTPELRHLFLVSHALVRTSLSRYAHVAPRDWVFSEAEHGRPEISGPAGHPPLRFNLSHTVGLVACLVCGDFEAGVDVERVARVSDLPGVAKRVYSQPEIADVMSRQGYAREGRFTDFWVLKEAYIKARGMGFQLPLQKITFRVGDCGEIGLAFAQDFDDVASDWQLRLESLGDRFRLGVALRRGTAPERKVLIRESIPLS